MKRARKPAEFLPQVSTNKGGRPRKANPRSIVSAEYMARLGPERNNGDVVSKAMAEYCGTGKAFDLAKLVKVAEQNALLGKLTEWADVRKLNNGQLRMHLGRQLRSQLRQGLDVYIGRTVIPGHSLEYKKAPSKNWYPPKYPEPRKSIREYLKD